MINAYNLATSERKKITSDRVYSYDAHTTTDNKWMYFVSEREFKTKVRSPWGSRQPEPYYDKISKVYALALQPGLELPFLQGDTWKDDKPKEEPKKEDATER